MTISDPTAPDTIVLIHGFWVTPRSWEEWISYYQDKGYRVLAPAYPGFEVEVEALNADPTPIENLTVPAVVDHLTEVIGGLERPPILMGHSAGGVFTQLMLDRGYGAVGVVMDSAPTEGVPVVPLEAAAALRGALHLAASLGSSRFAHGVAPAGWTFDGPRRETTCPTGKVRVPTEPGLGASVDAAFGSSAELVASFVEEGA